MGDKLVLYYPHKGYMQYEGTFTDNVEYAFQMDELDIQFLRGWRKRVEDPEYIQLRQICVHVKTVDDFEQSTVLEPEDYFVPKNTYAFRLDNVVKIDAYSMDEAWEILMQIPTDTDDLFPLQFVHHPEQDNIVSKDSD